MAAQEPIRALIAQIDSKIAGLRSEGTDREHEISRWQACRRELECLIDYTEDAPDGTVVSIARARRAAR